MLEICFFLEYGELLLVLLLLHSIGLVLQESLAGFLIYSLLMMSICFKPYLMLKWRYGDGYWKVTDFCCLFCLGAKIEYSDG